MADLLTATEIAYLKVRYEAMTPGEYFVLYTNHPVIQDAEKNNILRVEECDQADDNALGFVAVHDAFPALIAAAEAGSAPFPLHDLCTALGWQGGTIWQALEEVKRMKADLTVYRELLASEICARSAPIKENPCPTQP